MQVLSAYNHELSRASYSNIQTSTCYQLYENDILNFDPEFKFILP